MIDTNFSDKESKFKIFPLFLEFIEANWVQSHDLIGFEYEFLIYFLNRKELLQTAIDSVQTIRGVNYDSYFCIVDIVYLVKHLLINFEQNKSPAEA